MDQKQKAAFEHVYHENFDLVRYYLRKLRVSEDQIDDITHECFMRLIKHMDSVDLERVTPYLFTMARNIVNDRFRQQKRRKTTNFGEEPAGEQEALWLSDQVRTLECALVSEALEEFCQNPEHECFALFYRDGLSMQEICDKLQMPSGTLSSRLYRLRKKFKPLIDGKLQNAEEQR